MKILMVAHAFPPYVGGLSYVIENLSVNLAKRGFDVEVVTLDVNGNLPRYEEYKGVIVKRFRGYAPDGCYFAPSIECVRYLKSIGADVMHIHNVGSLLTLFTLNTIEKRNSKPKIVVTPHHHEGGSKWHTKLGWIIYKPIIRRALKKADVVHAVSNYEASLIKRDFGVEPIVISNGVSEDVFNYRWNPPKDRVVITYAGRVEKYKRVDFIVKIAHKLSKVVKEKVVIRIIGRGSYLQGVLKLAKHYSVEVEAPGFLPRNRYLEALANSTIFMNVSKQEAYSIVTAEALTIGIPSIIVKPWGLNFKGVNHAYIIDPNDMDSIMNVILKIIRLTRYHDLTWYTKSDCPTQSWSIIVNEMIKRVYTLD